MHIDEEKLTKIFGEIETALDSGGSLNFALQQASQRFGVKKESVKNYYYRMIKILRSDPKMAKERKIDLSKFKNVTFDKFSQKEKDDLYVLVTQNLEKGISIRKTCMSLARGDAKLTLRLQNKYRNMKSQKRREELDLGTGKKSDQVTQNVIDISLARDKFKSKITDSEINALFMGLVKIVKKSAVENANSQLKFECECANQNFRQSLAKASSLERQLEKERQVNKSLSLKIENQTRQICLLLDRLSTRKLKGLERKSKQRSLRLKNFEV